MINQGANEGTNQSTSRQTSKQTCKPESNLAANNKKQHNVTQRQTTPATIARKQTHPNFFTETGLIPLLNRCRERRRRSPRETLNNSEDSLRTDGKRGRKKKGKKERKNKQIS